VGGVISPLSLLLGINHFSLLLTVLMEINWGSVGAKKIKASDTRIALSGTCRGEGTWEQKGKGTRGYPVCRGQGGAQKADDEGGTEKARQDWGRHWGCLFG